MSSVWVAEAPRSLAHLLRTPRLGAAISKEGTEGEPEERRGPRGAASLCAVPGRSRLFLEDAPAEIPAGRLGRSLLLASPGASNFCWLHGRLRPEGAAASGWRVHSHR